MTIQRGAYEKNGLPGDPALSLWIVSVGDGSINGYMLCPQGEPALGGATTAEGGIAIVDLRKAPGADEVTRLRVETASEGSIVVRAEDARLSGRYRRI